MASPLQEFREQMRDKQSVFKAESLGVKQMGSWRNIHYPHLLPEEAWSLNLWEGTSYQAIRHFAQAGISWSEQKHSMLSSQVLCVNLFFPLRNHPEALKPWLASHFDVDQVVAVEFQYVGPDDRDYFNEEGTRGPGRIRADVAIAWLDRSQKKNVLLIKFTFAERSLGMCSQRGNPSPWRCHYSRNVVGSPHSYCHKDELGFTYWYDIMSRESPFLQERLTLEGYCPFRYDLFALMRGQLLAHMLQEDNGNDIARAYFGVMYHADNDELLRMPHWFYRERNPLRAWPTLLKDESSFRPFTIQEMVAAMEGALPGDLSEWRAYLKQRYGL